MPGPRDWGARAANQGMAVHGGIVPGVAVQTPSSENEEDKALNDALLELARDAKRERLEDAIAEAADRRRMKALQRKIDMDKLERRAAGLPPDPSNGHGGSGDGGGDSNLVQELLADWRTERGELMKRLDTISQAQAAAGQNNVAQQLEALKTQIANTALTPSVNPLQQMVDAFKMAQEVRNVTEQFTPAAPLPPPLDPGLSHSQMIEQERMTLEHEIRMIDARTALEKVQYNRDQLAQEREAKNERLQGLLNMGEQVLGKVAEGLAPSLGGLFGGLGGGGGSAPPAVSTPAPAIAQGAAPVAPQMIPWVCPTCKSQNSAPPGTAQTRCGKCGMGPIILRPRMSA